MIVCYRDKRARDFAAGNRVKAFSGIERPARLKLALPGNRKGQYSIRVNGKWRICFEWPDRAPGRSNVELVDSH